MYSKSTNSVSLTNESIELLGSWVLHSWPQFEFFINVEFLILIWEYFFEIDNFLCWLSQSFGVLEGVFDIWIRTKIRDWVVHFESSWFGLFPGEERFSLEVNSGG